MPRSSRKPDPKSPLVDPRLEVHELRASRARIVAETYSERRRIEGSLHDGVQQHLVALVVNLQLARQFAETDPAALSPLLDEIARDVREALEGVRELAHGIYPPLLLDRGLSEAIGAAVSVAASPTRVESASLDRYVEDLEATVYFCCIDALGIRPGSIRAGATVRIWQDDATLNFDVTHDDDGHDPRPALEVSDFDSMRDRIGAVGGRLTVGSSPAGGTRISGVIPLGS